MRYLPSLLAFTAMADNASMGMVATLLPHFGEDLSTDQAILFFETQAPLTLSGRKLCAIESAAIQNPNMVVFALINAKGRTLSLPSNWMARRATHFPNARFLSLNVSDYMRKSRLKRLWQEHISSTLDENPKTASNLLRVLFLHAFGGVYLDTVIMI